MGVKNRVVALTVGMVVLAGILSGAVSFFSTRHAVDGYDNAVTTELERKARAYATTGRTLLPPSGDAALAFIDSVIDEAFAESALLAAEEPTTSPDEFENPLLGFSARVPDPSAPAGLRIVSSGTLDGFEEVVAASEQQVQLVAAAAAERNGAEAVIDPDQQIVHGAIPISAEGEPVLVATFTLSAHDEFAFLAAQRSSAIRTSLLTSVGIVVGVAVVGAGLSLFVSRDLTSRRRTEEALREQTRRDPLTGVLNHAAIIADLERLLGRDDDTPAAVVMVDVDGMKATNDTFGHQIGDAALKAVAEALSHDGATVGRYGGDEFVAILDGHDRKAGERFQRTTAKHLKGVSLTDPASGIEVPVSVSMGLAVWPEDAASVTELVGLADHAMYASRLRRPLPPNGDGMPRRRDERALMMIGEIAPLLTSDGRLEDKLQLVAHRLAVGAKYDAVSIELVEPSTGRVVTNSYAPSIAGEIIETWHNMEREAGGAVWRDLLERTRRPIIVHELTEDHRFSDEVRQLAATAGVHSLLTTPMLWHDEVMGTLTVASRRSDAFTPGDAQFVSAVATQVTAIARLGLLLGELEHATGRLSEAHEETIMLLATAAETRDHTMGPHCHRVRRLSELLAAELGWPADRCQELGLAAALHDVGKIYLPDAVLASTGPLAADERREIEQHTIRGEQLLRDRPGFELAALVARCHHERWDGAGYPSGVAGDEIPEAAAIVGVADAFDAMTAVRTYHEPMSIEDAVAEVAACAGRQFSPRVAEALSRLHQRGALHWPATAEQQAA